MLVQADRTHIKAMRDQILRSRTDFFHGACLYCLEEIPEEKFDNGGFPKFCSPNHRKRFNARRK